MSQGNPTPSQTAVDQLREMVSRHALHSVRLVFADQHGLPRGKTVDVSALDEVLDRGIGVTASILLKDTGGEFALPLWKPAGGPTLEALNGGRNIVMRPDPTTFRVLPWVERTGWMICDLETIEGETLPLSTRGICRAAAARLGERSLRFRGGLELELHLYRLDPSHPGGIDHSHGGWDLLGEDSLDRAEPVLGPIRDGLAALGLPPRSIEAELGPSQVELTFPPTGAVELADQAFLVRGAVRQIARRHGYHATFMCRPAVGDAFPSGWHLHQSLTGPDSDVSLFTPGQDTGPLGPLGRHYVGGLLRHAAASCLLTTPTVNGYKRYRPKAVAPDRISWSQEHRGVMLRVVGGSGDPSTRVENRAGDPAANPYLYLASQMISGLDGIDNGIEPPAPTETPYEPAGGTLLPRSLGEAIEAFAASDLYRRILGEEAVRYLLAVKGHEWRRFLAAVTDWEQREYFELF